ncbi:MAG: hypothetical protein ACXQS5_03925 [Candidatus Methanospirareceae archaeon]
MSREKLEVAKQIVEELTFDELISLKSYIDDKIREATTENEWWKIIAKRIPFFAEARNKVKIIVCWITENHKWVYIGFSASKAVFFDLQDAARSAGVHCWADRKPKIFIGGKRYDADYVIALLKEDLLAEEEEEEEEGR